MEKKLLGPRFKKDAKKVEVSVAALDQQAIKSLVTDLAEKASVTGPTEELVDGRTTVDLTQELCTIQKVKRAERIREYTPNVVELSFGVGRVQYSPLEQVY